MGRELLTVSRMNTLLSCPRKHYYRYELGLVSIEQSEALIFGTAWHRGMEKYLDGESYDTAIEYALADSGDQINELQATILAGLLAGYYQIYGGEPWVMTSECQFEYPLHRSLTFSVAGKIDGLGTMHEKNILLEHKTTSASIDNDSDFWLRLRWNGQVLQYLDACEQAGWAIDSVIYDVVRKPAIRPISVPDVDENGKKIVVDSIGNRIYKKDGSPRESADTAKGYVVVKREETMDEYYERLYNDVLNRPEFYFARREVQIFANDLEAFKEQRLQIGRMILMFRASQKKVADPASAWARNCNEMTCKSCEYASFCLLNINANENNVPENFKLQAPNSELATTEETK